MNTMKCCRLGNAPFKFSRPAACRVHVVWSCRQRSDSKALAPAAGLAQFFLPGLAWAEEIANDAQDIASQAQQKIDLPTSLPESLPTPEEVITNAPAAGGSLLDIFTDNPIVVFGLLFLAAVPLVLNFFGGGALGVKQVNAAGALEGLTTDPNTVLIDIRSREEAKEQGNPNLSSTKKKAIALPFTRLVQGEAEQVEDFEEKFGKLKQIQSDTSIILLDSYGQEAPDAAKLLTKAVGRVYYVQDGAIGPNGWKESGQPWKEPGLSLLNLDSLAEDFKSQPTLTKAGVALGAVGVAAAVLLQEAGAVLELGALAAAGAFVIPRFLERSSSGGAKKEAKEVADDGQKAVKQSAAKAKKTSQKASQQASKAAQDTSEEALDLGAKAQKAAGSLQDSVKKAAPKESKAEETSAQATDAAEGVGEKAEEVASDVKDSISERSGEARKWIDDWKKDQSK